MRKENTVVEKPWLVYDGDCAFCKLWIERWKEITGDNVRYEPFQSLDELGIFPQIPLEAFQKSVQLILPDGRVFHGANAVFRSLSYAPGSKGQLIWFYENFPGFRSISEWIYDWVTAHRPLLYKLTVMLKYKKWN